MESSESGTKQHISVRDLYPHLNDEQLKEAEENLERYLELTLRIYDRIRRDPDAYARFKTLTARGEDRYYKESKRSNIKFRT
jgi:hypothetical protein